MIHEFQYYLELLIICLDFDIFLMTNYHFIMIHQMIYFVDYISRPIKIIYFYQYIQVNYSHNFVDKCYHNLKSHIQNLDISFNCNFLSKVLGEFIIHEISIVISLYSLIYYIFLLFYYLCQLVQILLAQLEYNYYCFINEIL